MGGAAGHHRQAALGICCESCRSGPCRACRSSIRSVPRRAVRRRRARARGPCRPRSARVPRGLFKFETLRALVDRLGSNAERPRILCGDFNTPREELADGTVRFWGDRRPAHRERWNRAEHAVVLGLAEHDLADVFRRLNGYSLEAVSWSSQRTTGRHSRRYDDVFESGLWAPPRTTTTAGASMGSAITLPSKPTSPRGDAFVG